MVSLYVTSRLDAADAEALNVPHICLASPDEPADAVAQFKEVLSRPGRTGHVETYGRPMFHGWMGKSPPMSLLEKSLFVVVVVVVVW